MPSLVGGKSLEVSGLKLGDEFNVKLRVFSHSVRLTVVVCPVAKDLCHVSIAMLPVEGLLSERFIHSDISGPG
jgi:hypothetical protein